MCGRFAFFAKQEEIERIFPGTLFEFWPPARYNIAPGYDILSIIASKSAYAAISLRWGLVPAWAKDSAIGNTMINARAETVAEKPSFKKPFLHQRCIIPASGFFEWKKAGKNKIPHFIRFRSKELMLFAGLYDRWKKPDGSTLSSGTIITRPAPGAYIEIHDRMPAILRREAALQWISPQEMGVQTLQKILEQVDDSEIEIFPVSSIVNNPKTDVPQCIEQAVSQKNFD